MLASLLELGEHLLCVSSVECLPGQWLLVALFCVPVTVTVTIWGKRVKGKGTVEPLMEVFHDTATECHLPYGITQCYLLPDTSEHTPP